MSADNSSLPPAPDRPLVALYQPDIAGNTGTILRSGACLGFAVAVIGPAGFDLSDRALRRAGMDYLEIATLRRHDGWDAFEAWRREAGRRLVLLTTRASEPYTAARFRPTDILLFGRESAGVPEAVHDAADLRLTIPMRPGARSLNLAVSVGIVVSEAIRQLGSIEALTLPES
ncbi:tRNA (cytidine(34)-2'-O)-methyltransferase [Aureimonas endophytica]|uniref:tRNA (cytidine(34)-2'-O)-methyltransferase n=1 Tax=Aureimonas endophytica TaxID=2027858 RepID=A0A917EAG1_9HYPH|nr:tRNA (cytidine(34)-2'-O)-methyltransferase [Aureimonas endophytica]GGE19243.1 tRNA (cytidine(34)-2'-O)-methyltransferase [Aureimonas endophytica]